MRPMQLCVSLLIASTISGCVSQPEGPQPIPDSQVSNKIQVLLEDVRNEMKRISTANIRYGKDLEVKGCTTRIVSVEFFGDVTHFLDDLRNKRFCEIRVAGTKPPRDMILSLKHTKVPLWHVLEDANVQLGGAARFSIGEKSILVSFGQR